MKTIEMIARVSDQVLSVGRCTSAQARILVKQNHAAWQDGKLLLPLNPELLNLAVNQPTGPSDTGPLTLAETHRRMDWLRSLLGVQAITKAERGVSRIPDIVGREVPVEGGSVLYMLSKDYKPEVEDPADLAEWYDLEAAVPEEQPNDRGRVFPHILDSLWEAAPNLQSTFFGLPGPSTRTDVWPPLPVGEWMEKQSRYGEVTVVEKPAFHKAKWPKVIFDVGDGKHPLFD